LGGNGDAKARWKVGGAKAKFERGAGAGRRKKGRSGLQAWAETAVLVSAEEWG